MSGEQEVVFLETDRRIMAWLEGPSGEELEGLSSTVRVSAARSSKGGSGSCEI